MFKRTFPFHKNNRMMMVEIGATTVYFKHATTEGHTHLVGGEVQFSQGRGSFCGVDFFQERGFGDGIFWGSSFFREQFFQGVVVPGGRGQFSCKRISFSEGVLIYGTIIGHTNLNNGGGGQNAGG